MGCLTLACCYTARPTLTWSSTPMSTELPAWTLVTPRRAMTCSSGTTWSAKRQTVVSRSSTEAKYRAVANGVVEVTWLRQLLHELQAPPSHCTLVYCNNISVVYLSTNPIQHQRTKHVEIDLHFV
jgi:hypothetical protein